MKKNVIFRIAAIVLMCTLVTACFASSTFAKYTSQAKGDANVVVAKWLINAGKDAAGKTDIYVANGTAKTINLEATVTEIGGGAENEVATAKIAPGTEGTFDLYVENASDVDAQYKFVLDKTKLPAGLADKLTFTYKVGDDATVTENNFRALDMGTNQTVKVSWVWAFEDGTDATDISDTVIGHASDGTTEYPITITLTVEQVD